MKEIEVISHLNILVGHFPFTKMISLTITHSPNTFGRCVVVGEMEAETAQSITQRSDETTQTEVVTTAAGQPQRLFCGIVEDIGIEYFTEYARVTVKLLDSCKMLDFIPHKRSYQNTSHTYGQLIQSCMAGEGTAEVTVTDKMTGTLIVQYDETNWAFSQRMASQLGVPIVSDLRTEKPHLYVGLPPSDQTQDLTSSMFQFGKRSMPDSAGSTSTILVSEDSSSLSVDAYYYTFIGNYVQVKAGFYAVKSMEAKLVDGILKMTYELLPMGNAQPSAGDQPAIGGLTAPSISNKSCSGKMLTGKVVNVAGNKVQVQFSFDAEFSGDHWFEYSTAYSSSEQSGWYCMPEKDDIVRVFFPSGSEGEAFAASSSPKFAAENPKDKVWMAHGKCIQLTEKGIHISCDGEQAIIDLSPTDGILIYTQSSLTVSAKELIEICGKQINIIADNKISVGTDRAFIDITGEKITMLGSEVVIE